MQIAGVFCVNEVKDDDFKILNTYNILLFPLFCDFILSKKTNQFNKQKVC